MSEPPTMTDADVQAIVDKHAPSQGERWDMAAMLHEAHAAGSAWGYEQGARDMQERAAQLCDEWGDEVSADAIRALDPAPEPRECRIYARHYPYARCPATECSYPSCVDPAPEEPRRCTGHILLGGAFVYCIYELSHVGSCYFGRAAAPPSEGG